MSAAVLQRLAVPALAISLVACGGIPPTPPTHIVNLAHNDFGDFVLLVYDDSGLVTNALSSDQQNQPVVANPDRNELTVSWTGGACAHGPKLAITGDASALSLELDAAPFQFSAVPVACPAIGLLFAVTLSLDEPVEQDALNLKLLSR
ncbi:MAG: hypothetical protein ABI797_06590 [Chloroflexota bacterium]